MAFYKPVFLPGKAGIIGAMPYPGFSFGLWEDNMTSSEGPVLPAGGFYFKSAYQTDKFESGLMAVYVELFQAYRFKPITFLEIGIGQGGSISFFQEYFKHPDAKIIGIDIRIPDFKKGENTTILNINQNDSKALETLAADYGPFDVILDDGAHFAKETQNCFDILFPYLKVGGSYIIEDWMAEYMGSEFKGMIDLVHDIGRSSMLRGIREYKIESNYRGSYAHFRKEKNI